MSSLEAQLEEAQAVRMEKLREAEARQRLEEERRTQSTVTLKKTSGSLQDIKVKAGVRHIIAPLRNMSEKSQTKILNIDNGKKEKIPPKAYKHPPYWDFPETKQDVKKDTEAIGFSLNSRNRAGLRPDWANKMIEGGFDCSMGTQGLTVDEVAAYLEEKNELYQLSEFEITELQKFIELQLLIESDPEIGKIEGGTEVLGLVTRFAEVGGNLLDMGVEDQSAILTLLQFNNVVLGENTALDDNRIEVNVDGANNFVQYVDTAGVTVFIRKGSFVKCQIFENKIKEELEAHNDFINKWSLVFMITAILYLLLKVVICVYGGFLSGTCNGFYQAMMKLEQINEEFMNQTVLNNHG